jgi:membrane-associated phospholipid phosphatase
MALYVYFVRTRNGQVIDQLAYDGADFSWRSVTLYAQRLLDALPAVSGVAGLVLTLVIAAVRRRWRALIIAFGAAGAAAATTQILKYVILDRPDFGVEGYAGNSFPSGHTTAAAASAMAVFLVSSPRARAAVAAWGTAFSVLAGVSTLANQWHRPSDVIAALLVVAFWGCLAGALLETGRPAPVRSGGVFATAWWVVAPFVLVTAVSFLVTFRSAANGSESANTVLAYIGGASAIITVGFVLALVATRTFSRLP